ncbi:MAG: 3-oxoacyl-ACP reductase FabG [Planctomycetaceae bacterium]|nr:3-oxoacyl-ACP reductase FabG [Planctomycetaceae bacterium]
MPFDLQGRVALVTGSTTGLGRAIAIGLGRAGAKVAMNYFRNAERAERAFADFQAQGCQGKLFRADASQELDVDHLARHVAEQLGPIDILVVNATPDQPLLPIEQYTWRHYETMLDFFIKSPYLLTRACLPHMKQQRHGRIINITSEVFDRGVGNFSAYVSAKGGQVGFTRSMATELAPFNITVNQVAPGWIPVERHANDPQTEKDAYRALIPMNRWGTPEDVAGAVVYFASDEAGFVTGQCLSVNGGMTRA